MSTRNIKALMCGVVVMLQVNMTASILWDEVQCASDADENVPDGTVADIGRFPWLGVVQHSFYIGGATRFAITTGVLIHPAYAIAPAEDISRISHDQLRNNTKFIMWHSSSVKHVMEVNDYLLHPEFEERPTLATLALLELVSYGQTSVMESSYPALPVCMPITGGGAFTDLYAAKMTDDERVLQKEVHKMNFVDDKPCKEFYNDHKLTYSKMTPVEAICAKTELTAEPCVWDGGVALITRQTYGFWKLIGFSVRGPGCGAPARFLVVNNYMSWINDRLSELPDDQVEEVHRLGVRRLAPMKIAMFNADRNIPNEIGNCERRKRGGVLYKDTFEVLMNKDFGQGYFYVVVSQIAQFQCALVNVEESTARSNTGVWLEHYCHREITGIAHGQNKPVNYRKQECFLYFKSAAFVEFRFYFSFKAAIEITLFGKEEVPRFIPNPFVTDETTDDWWPTSTKIQWGDFIPYYHGVFKN